MNLKDTLKSLKLHEATISMILGAVVIIIVGVVLVNYLAGRRGQTIPALEVGDESPAATQEHKVAAGEDLWSISEKYYGTGFNWEDIARANGITDPNQIEEGQTLIIPEAEAKLAAGSVSPTEEPIAMEDSEEAETSAKPTDGPTVKPTLIASSDNNEDDEQESNTTTSTYVVQEGDNLWKIASARYSSGYNWVDIAQANDLSSPYMISEGQELNIPDVDTKIAGAESGSDEETEIDITGESYTVVKGDNLWDIAVRAYGDGYKWTEIAEENSLLHPNIIHPGNELKLPR